MSFSPGSRHVRLLSQEAFTLIELLTVIAIIGVLAAIIIPTVSRVRESSRRSVCSSNLRQIGMAFQLYASENQGFYPAPRQPDISDKLPTGVYPLWANPLGSNWPVEISRYVYRDQKDIGAVKDTSGASNIAHCPSYDLLFNSAAKLTAQNNISAAGYGMNYQLNVGGVALGSGTLSPKTRFRASAVMNPGKSVLIGDSSNFFLNPYAGWTADSTYADGYNNGAPTRHGGSANYLYADGHVGTLSPADAANVVKFIR